MTTKVDHSRLWEKCLGFPPRAARDGDKKGLAALQLPVLLVPRSNSEKAKTGYLNVSIFIAFVHDTCHLFCIAFSTERGAFSCLLYRYPAGVAPSLVQYTK